MNIIIGTLMKYKKILTTRDYNLMNNKTLLILNSIDGLRDWAIFNTTVIIQHSNYRYIKKKHTFDGYGINLFIDRWGK